MEKVGRNDPCPCGSGKKFKKCCENQMLGGRFRATKVEAESAPAIHKTVNLTSLFQSHLSVTPKKPTPSSLESEKTSSDSPDKKSLSDSLEKKEDI